MFLNLSSGAKLPPAERERLRAAATDAGVEVIDLRHGVDVAGIIRERLQQERRLFIAAGGDGTVNSVIQPLVHTEAALAVIPVGTYNHFARDLGIPLDWPSALDVALNGQLHQIDTARANDRFFINNMSIGLYPELVARREERGRDYPRWKARLYALYMTMRKYPHVSFTVETEHHQVAIRTHVFMVSNNSYDLSRIGIEAPRNLMTEGRMSVYWLPHLPRIALMRFAAHYLAGRVTKTPGFRMFRTAQMKVQSRHASLHVGLDGEVHTITMPMTVTIVPQSLLVKVPRDAAALAPFRG
jgi:YegS/Rv2252/BmrU family lipid kinase